MNVHLMLPRIAKSGATRSVMRQHYQADGKGGTAGITCELDVLFAADARG